MAGSGEIAFLREEIAAQAMQLGVEEALSG
jgi:hypothetical protein